MTKTPNLIDMHQSCHHSREKPLRPPFFKKRAYKKWNDPDEDENSNTSAKVPSPTLVPNINVIAPKTKKIHGTGWQCHMYKMYTIYYKTFLQDEVIQNEWTEAVNLTPIECELMVRNKRCHNFDMICSDVNSCHYEGVRVPNYAWLKEHTGVVYNCNYYKRTIVAADLASNLFGINGCTADKLYCNLHDSIVIWTNQIIDQCAFDVLLRTDLYVEDDDILVDRENKLLFKVTDNRTVSCISIFREKEIIQHIDVYTTAEGLWLTSHPYFSTQKVVKGDSLQVANEFLFSDRDLIDNDIFDHLSEDVC
jgi:hypothetical protein